MEFTVFMVFDEKWEFKITFYDELVIFIGNHTWGKNLLWNYGSLTKYVLLYKFFKLQYRKLNKKGLKNKNKIIKLMNTAGVFDKF